MSKVRCDNCDWEGDENDVGKSLCEIRHLWDRITPGGTVPAGECPECESLCYPVEEEKEEAPKFGWGVMTDDEATVIRALRHRGFAVIVWTPEELLDADPQRVEDRGVELTSEVIAHLNSMKG